MSRSSAEPPVGACAARGQVEPLPAVVAVLVVAAGVGAYAGAVGDALARHAPDRGLADRTLDAAGDHLRRGGAARPGRLSSVGRVAPAGHRLNVTLAAAGREWHAGPSLPEPTAEGVEAARRRVGVRLGPGRVGTGWLEVAVW